jgi:hypothetical protein
VYKYNNSGRLKASDCFSTPATSVKVEYPDLTHRVENIDGEVNMETMICRIVQKTMEMANLSRGL